MMWIKLWNIFSAFLLILTVVSGHWVQHVKNAGICIGCGIVCLHCFTEVVSTGDALLIERLGKYHRSLGPGWHVIGRPLEAVSFRNTLREQILDIPPQQCYTSDNAPIRADAVIFMKIADMYKAKYEVENLRESLYNLVLTNLREQIGQLTLDETFTSRDRINQNLLAALSGATSQWGVTISRVEIQNILPSPEILSSMELQMSAERKKRAAILQSEGEKTTLINTAEGKAQAALAAAEAESRVMEVMAQAKSEKMRIEAQGMKSALDELARDYSESSDAALQALLLKEYMETQAKFAASDATKVYMFPTKDSIPLSYQGLSSLLK